MDAIPRLLVVDDEVPQLRALETVLKAEGHEVVACTAPAEALARLREQRLGHSGRPLVLGRVAAFAFIVVQLVTVTRVAAELVANAAALQLVAAIGWLVAFLPWVLRSAWIYLTPRADGAAG